MMKERPILFSGPMVRAIIDGRKTQTRRVVKPQPQGEWAAPGKSACPYGMPGDRLWAKEAFRLGKDWDKHSPGQVFANPPPKVWYEADGPAPDGLGRLRASIHMPQAIARLTLEIKSVRVERVQDISANDAQAEGIAKPRYDEGRYYSWVDSWVDPFRDLWDSINGKTHPWASNPWVWVVAFARVAAP